jgi:hypothetical protein
VALAVPEILEYFLDHKHVVDFFFLPNTVLVGQVGVDHYLETLAVYVHVRGY